MAIFVKIETILNFVSFGIIYSSTCGEFKLSKDNLNIYLIGHSIMYVNGTNHHECARTCMSFSVCKSIDFDKKENICKLNDVNRSSVEQLEFETKQNSVFSDISDWCSSMVQSCSSKPCKANQRCYPNGASYVCRDIICDNVQKIESGKIQIYNAGENMFLDKASVKCDIGFFPSQQEVKCDASGKWQPALCKKPSDCKEILDRIPEAKTGQYDIKLWNSGKILSVNCDMETKGGGWTMFHRRIDGSVEFYRNFSEYENGFGSVEGEFWLGLKYIQELAEQGPTEIRLDMTRSNNKTGHETYQDFTLTEGTNYTLNIGSRVTSSGFDGDGLLNNNQHPFSTFDKDLDKSSGNCAVANHGAWWYNSCSFASLNGKYVTPGSLCNLYGYKIGYCGHKHLQFDGYHALRTSHMMIRRN